jgi:hypothetical protein
MREKARAEGRSPRYDGRWRDRDPSEAPAGVKPSSASRRRSTGETVDRRSGAGPRHLAEQGSRRSRLLRSDGTPTYMLAVVVDDHDMGVTHIIRGDDHLTNAARQKQIYDALGWDVPDDGAHPADPRPGRREALQAPRRARRRCLSRDGLPAGGDAQLSRPARLEPRRRGDLVDRGDDRWFDLDGIGRSPARFDFAKLEKPQRPLHPAMPDAELFAAFDATLPHLAGGAELRGEARRRTRAAQAARGDAGPEGAREDAGRADRRRGFIGTIGPTSSTSKLYAETGMFTYDPGFTSTASCESKITYIDGDEGILLYRGYPIEQLAEHGDFLETCYLLLYGELPTPAQKADFDHRVTATRWCTSR